MAISKYFIATSLLLLLFVLLPSASADDAVGCCIETNDTYGFNSDDSFNGLCIDKGVRYSIMGVTSMNESECDKIFGIWSGFECDALSECEDGCCCQSEGYYTYGSNASCPNPENFKPSASSDNCANECFPTTYHTVSGIVQDADEKPISGINITINTPWQLVQTNESGGFKFEGVSSDDAVFHAYNETCDGVTYEYISSNRTDIVVNITCASSTTGGTGGNVYCDNPEWECTTNPRDACNVRYDECLASNCNDISWDDFHCGTDDDTCEVPLLPYKPCLVSGDTCNPNGELNEGEACDDDGETILVASGKTTCSEYPPFESTNQVGCVDCQIDTSVCDICPSNPTYCTQEQCDAECPGCSPFCPTLDCLSEAPTFSSNDITYPDATADVNLHWSFKAGCVNYITNFEVEICDGNPAENPSCQTKDFPITDFHESTSFTLGQAFTNLMNNTNYYYKVSAYMLQDGIQKKTSSDYWPKETGDAYCMQEHPDEFCNINVASGAEVRQQCGEIGGVANKIIVNKKCDEGTVCLGPNTDGETTCSYNMSCYYCNGLYGMYGYLAYKKPFSVPFFNGEDTMSKGCNDDPIFSKNEQQSGTIPTCYYERTKTVSDELSLCSNIKTCYDYHNEEACQESPCLDADCEWHDMNPYNSSYDSLSDQTGIGVCAPQEKSAPADGSKLKIYEQPICEMCDTDTFFTPACTHDFCVLYNNTERGCYYARNTASGRSCYSPDEVSCNIYQTKEDCEGEGEDHKKYELNITYHSRFYLNNNHKQTRVQGDHKRVQNSSDYFAYGVCEWLPSVGKCIKNADKNYVDISAEENYETDCDAQTNGYPRYFDPSCGTDIEPPTTTLNTVPVEAQPWETESYPVYSSKELFSFTVNDNVFPQTFKDYETITTRFGFRPENFFDELVNKNINILFEGTLTPIDAENFTFNGNLTGKTENGYTAKADFVTGTLHKNNGNYDVELVGLVRFNNTPDSSGYVVSPTISFNLHNNDVASGEISLPKEDATITVVYDYPSLRYEDLKNEVVGENGDYVVTYYSIDGSKNLEEVRSTTITFDTAPPKIEDYYNETSSYLYKEDQYRSNVSITYKLSDDHGKISCNNTLIKQEGDNIIKGFGGDRYIAMDSMTEVTLNYAQLRDGYYQFVMNCTDHESLNNRMITIKDIKIDADKSITNSQPTPQVFNMTTAKNGIELSVQTEKEATCYYMNVGLYKEEDGFEQFEDYGNSSDTSEDKKTHTITVELNEEKLYQYHVGCNFSNDKTTYASPSDMIFFSVDDTAPTTHLINESGDPLITPVYAAHRNIGKNPTDATNTALIFKNISGDVIVDWNAGIAKTYYCLSGSNAKTQQQRENLCRQYTEWPNDEKITFNEDNIEGRKYLYYYSVDNVGNAELIKKKEVLVRNLDVYINNVEICDLQGENCWFQSANS